MWFLCAKKQLLSAYLHKIQSIYQETLFDFLEIFQQNAAFRT